MEKEKIQELIMKYNEGLADPSEVKQLEKLIEAGKIDLSEFPNLTRTEEQLLGMETPMPSAELDDRFYAMLSKSKASSARRSFAWKEFFSLSRLTPVAAAACMLIIGFFIGFYVQRPVTTPPNTTELSEEIAELKEMVMLSLLEKESASERLRAVSLVQEMDDASTKVTKALLQTLNEDDNINVRLAALEALKPYAANSTVRAGIVRSIARQKSPLLQIALAELMASIQEKSSVQELEKIIHDKNTPEDVKKRIHETIQVMI
jgi:hypothetical protein